MTHTRTFDESFARLVAAWEQHEAARQSADLGTQFAARAVLDDARLAMAQARTAA